MPTQKEYDAKMERQYGKANKFSDLHFPGAPLTEIIKAADSEIARLTARLRIQDHSNQWLRRDLKLGREVNNRVCNDNARLGCVVRRESKAYRECRDREHKMFQENHDLRAKLAADGRRRTCAALNKDLAQALSNATLYQEAHLAASEQRGVLADKLHEAGKKIKNLEGAVGLFQSQCNAETERAITLQKVVEGTRETKAVLRKQISNWSDRYRAEKRSSDCLQVLNNNLRERTEALLRDRRELAARTTNTIFAPPSPGELVAKRRTRLEQIIEDQRRTIVGFISKLEGQGVKLVAAAKAADARREQSMEQGIEINCLCRQLEAARAFTAQVQAELRDFKNSSRFAYNNAMMENKDLRNKVRELKDNPQLLCVPSDGTSVVIHHMCVGPTCTRADCKKWNGDPSKYIR